MQLNCSAEYAPHGATVWSNLTLQMPWGWKLLPFVRIIRYLLFHMGMYYACFCLRKNYISSISLPCF